jgi:excisionase family DNA binding protein
MPATTESQSPATRPDLNDLDLLTPDDVCTLLKIKKSWLYDEVEAGRLDALRLGKQLRFRRSDLARYLDERAKSRLRQRRQKPLEPPSRGLPGRVEHVHVPGGGPQVRLAKPVHDRLRAFSGIDQP